MKTDIIPEIAIGFMSKNIPIKGKCFSFIHMVYEQAGLSIDFYYQPIITSIDDLSIQENIGKIIFLMRRGSSAHLFSHLAIIYDKESVIHYSRRMKGDMVYRIEISSFKEIFEVYDLVANPYISRQNRKVKSPQL
jgi:hypothetical protein